MRLLSCPLAGSALVEFVTARDQAPAFAAFAEARLVVVLFRFEARGDPVGVRCRREEPSEDQPEGCPCGERDA